MVASPPAKMPFTDVVGNGGLLTTVEDLLGVIEAQARQGASELFLHLPAPGPRCARSLQS
jgi:exosome complex RNA-binding protein Csl4